ncbi:MAG: AAA family ATPase [Lentimicrobium sp.]|jgi:DNA repair exonuclease SbcCD ATPase subunit|nr:AAA family ATPase [Lentimicrobium sp.]
MKHLKINYLNIRNFKGIENLEVAFEKNTTIAGANATGKSTLLDAFTWLLFGKDSSERKDFNIKNTVKTDLNRADHIVQAGLQLGSVSYVIRRTYKEKWTKRRGSEETEFTGHETEFHWNEVPVNQTEFQSKVNFILEESQFKLLTNPMYFNSLKWPARRDMVSALAGDISLEDAAGNDSEMLQVVKRLQEEEKSLEDLLKQYAGSKKLLNKQLEALPGRIDEAMRTNGDNQEEIDIAAQQARLKELTDQVTTASASFERQRKDIEIRKTTVRTLEAQLMEVESAIKSEYAKEHEVIDIEISSLTREFSNLLREKDEIISEISSLHEDAAAKEKEVEKLRIDWHKINEKTLQLNDELKCPACHQDLPDAKEREHELVANFNTDKSNQLKAITKAGSSINTWLKNEYTTELERSTSRVGEIKDRLLKINKRKGELMNQDEKQQALKDVISNNDDVKRINKEIEEIEQEVVMVPSNKNLVELEQERDTVIRTIERFEQHQKAIEGRKARVDELKKQEKDLAQELALLEKQEFVINRLQANKVEMIEQAINSQFSMVTFQMFDKQINGGEKLTCETLVDGVPYQDANHAAQINAGIDIINTFSKHIGMTAPIWVDNAEAVNKIIDTECQLIKLEVTWDKGLIVK